MAASEETILSWNVANWITVILMTAVGFALLSVIQKIWVSVRDRKAATA